MEDELQALINEQRSNNPLFEHYYQIEKERSNRLVETECAYGNCTVWTDPQDPSYFASAGPVDCPCKA